MSQATTTHGRFASHLPGFIRRDPAVATAFACIIVLLLLGSLYSENFLSPIPSRRLKVASFLGVIATGMMVVILIGQIDLSVPWVVTTGAMMACAAASWGTAGVILSVPFDILCGAALGLFNGFGVAYLRIPSMIITLATNAVAQGLRSSIRAASRRAIGSPPMRYLATGFAIPTVPNAVIVWAVVGAAAVLLFGRTTFGRAVYGIGPANAPPTFPASIRAGW